MSRENLWTAASDGDTVRVCQLLRTGMSVNAQDQLGYSALHAVASYGHAALAEILLREGADVTLRDSDGDTPLHVCEDPAVAELLLRHGADSSALNEARQTPIDVARDEQRVEMLSFFAQKAGLNMQFTFTPQAEAAGAAGTAATTEVGGGATTAATAAPAGPPVAPGGALTPSARAHAESEREAGNKLFAQGDTEGALAKYTEAIEVDPRSHVSYCNRSACHAAAARWPESAADAHRCIEIEPTFVKGYFRFATALLRLGDADNTNGLHAMVLVEQALQLSPGNADLLELKMQCEQRAAAEQQKQQAAAAAAAATAT